MIADFATRFCRPDNYIAARRKQYPPIYQSEKGWAALFGQAVGLCPPIMQTRVAGGMIASGEIGERTPVACVTKFVRGYTIEMHSGLMGLIYSACRAIAARDDGRLHKQQKTFLSFAEVAANIATLFKNYQETHEATAQMFQATEFQTGVADEIAKAAETFLLMHELAHIYNEHTSWFGRLFGSNPADQLELEKQADATAGKWLFDYLLNPNREELPPQIFYAGAEFGLRVRMAMETAGMKFAKTHPSAGDRIATTRSQFREAVGSRKFYALASTSFAFDQMWRAIEQKLLDPHCTPAIKLTLDDLLFAMRTMVSILIKDENIKQAIVDQPVPGHPGQTQVVFVPTGPRMVLIMKDARGWMKCVQPEIRASAREHASDVFEPGTLEFSLLRVLLDLNPS